MKKLVLISFLLLIYNTSYSQTYRNMEWVKNYGSPDSIEWSSSTTDIYWNIITIGNTRVENEKTNILISKFDNMGALVWQTDWNGPLNGFDYGVDIICDVTGNIYALGTSNYSNDTTYDITIIKYDEDGSKVWETNYDGGMNDFPTKITNDSYGNVYIVGTMEGASTDYDYITLKIDYTNGILVWDATYDYNAHIDIGGDIVTDALGMITTVTGWQ